MRKLWIIPLLAILLAGCGKETALETVSDIEDTPVISTQRRIQHHLPEELSAPVLQSEETGTLYLCDDYSVTVQIMEAGDLQRTIRNASGMEKDDLQIIQTRQGNAKRYQWIWTAASEQGMQVGRGCVLDDGAYHYVLTALTDEDKAGKVQPQWREIFTSFSLATEQEEISTGS